MIYSNRWIDKLTNRSQTRKLTNFPHNVLSLVVSFLFLETAEVTWIQQGIKSHGIKWDFVCKILCCFHVRHQHLSSHICRYFLLLDTIAQFCFAKSCAKMKTFQLGTWLTNCHMLNNMIQWTISHEESLWMVRNARKINSSILWETAPQSTLWHLIFHLRRSIEATAW